jgi:mitochondrial distribution and morphology protein 34
MAFKFTWPTFSPSFYETASNLLTSALSKAPMPPIITDNIVVKEFNLGTTAPDLEMLEIGELGDDKFRGVFKLKYSGDAYIVLQTKVQVISHYLKEERIAVDTISLG